MGNILKRIITVLLISVAISFAALYIWSSKIINRKYDLPVAAVQVPKDSASIAEGERLVKIAHCGHCHGEDFSGGVADSISYIYRYVAPNISQLIPQYTDGELVRVIQEGIKKNGCSVYLMPSFMYRQMKTSSVEKMIAYLRTIPAEPTKRDLPTANIFYPLGRLKIIEGKLLAIREVMNKEKAVQVNLADTSEVGRGKYLVLSSCTSCHGLSLKGEQGFSPDLIIAAAYSRDQFYHLIKTGQGALGKKELNMMSDVARRFLSHLNTREIDAIYAYLQTRPTQRGL